MPIGVVAIVVARLVIDESRDTSARQRLDLPGLLSSAIALFALTYGLIEANNYGWSSARILALFALAGVGLTIFVLLELYQRAPMLDLSLFRNGTFAGANSVMLLVGLGMFGVFFYNSLFIQNVMGYSAVQTGATFLPMTVLIILVAPTAGRFSDRLGSRWLMGGGMLLLPQAELDDGRLDVLISKESSKLTFLRGIPKVFRGTHLTSPYVETLRGEVVEVSSDRPFVVYADGDPIGATPATMRVERRCLRVIVPRAVA